MKNTLKAWSISRYNLYKTCPFKFKCRVFDKLPEPKGEAMQRGIDIHSDAEKYLGKLVPRLPATLKQLAKDFAKIKKIGAFSEEKWAVTSQWRETEFFAPDAWLRFIVDAHYVVIDGVLKLIDFKTGKVRLNEGYEEQLELGALVAFKLFDLERVETELWFPDHGVIYGRGDNDDEDQEKFIYHIEDEAKLEKLWAQRIKPMFNDTRFEPTPNYSCRWCHFSKSNGGPCRY